MQGATDEGVGGGVSDAVAAADAPGVTAAGYAFDQLLVTFRTDAGGARLLDAALEALPLLDMSLSLLRCRYGPCCEHARWGALRCMRRGGVGGGRPGLNNTLVFVPAVWRKCVCRHSSYCL